MKKETPTSYNRYRAEKELKNIKKKARERKELQMETKDTTKKTMRDDGDEVEERDRKIKRGANQLPRGHV